MTLRTDWSGSDYFRVSGSNADPGQHPDLHDDEARETNEFAPKLGSESALIRLMALLPKWDKLITYAQTQYSNWYVAATTFLPPTFRAAKVTEMRALIPTWHDNITDLVTEKANAIVDIVTPIQSILANLSSHKTELYNVGFPSYDTEYARTVFGGGVFSIGSLNGEPTALTEELNPMITRVYNQEYENGPFKLPMVATMTFDFWIWRDQATRGADGSYVPAAGPYAYLPEGHTTLTVDATVEDLETATLSYEQSAIVSGIYLSPRIQIFPTYIGDTPVPRASDMYVKIGMNSPLLSARTAHYMVAWKGRIHFKPQFLVTPSTQKPGYPPNNDSGHLPDLPPNPPIGIDPNPQNPDD